jgi:hypothetical protein
MKMSAQKIKMKKPEVHFSPKEKEDYEFLIKAVRFYKEYLKKEKKSKA